MVVHTFIPVLGRQREEDLYEFKVSLVYVRSSRPTKATKGDSVSKTKKENYVKNMGVGGVERWFSG